MEAIPPCRAQQVGTMLLLLVSLLLTSESRAFVSQSASSLATARGHRRRSAFIQRVSQETEFAETVLEDGDDDSSATNQWATQAFTNGAQFLDMSLSSHRPLGCTVEESLASELDPSKQRHVFVSKVAPGGFAEQAGIQVGDVVVGVSGIFGDMENVMNLGIDKVKGLVTARPDDEVLELRVVRGTSVLADHEEALVALCSDPSLAGSDSEQCVVDYLQSGYDYAIDDTNDELETAMINGDSDETANGGGGGVNGEDLVDSLYNMWADDLPVSTPEPAVRPVEAPKEKAKPWSSRSSPSGTFVRDPTTGEMRNIDA